MTNLSTPSDEVLDELIPWDSALSASSLKSNSKRSLTGKGVVPLSLHALE